VNFNVHKTFKWPIIITIKTTGVKRHRRLGIVRVRTAFILKKRGEGIVCCDAAWQIEQTDESERLLFF